MFSIIIPTYNRAHLIGRTIQSCLKQTYPHFEIIVVDDGSTDNTEQIIKSIPSSKIKYFKITNSERGYARNYGITSSNQENGITFLDSDDILLENYLVRSPSYHNSTSRAIPDISYCGYSIVDANSLTIENLNNITIDINSILLTKGNPYLVATIL